MARQSKRLSARFVTTAPQGMHADGDGLYLIVGVTGAKRWAFIFHWHGKRTEMGLGKLAALSLADAREAAEQSRRLVARGENPIEVRNAARASVKAGETDFGTFASKLIDDLASQFRNAKHLGQWRTTLSVERDDKGGWLDTGYCLSIRSKRLDQITTVDVLAILKPLWQAKHATGSRLRGRIERVLDAAKAAGLRSGENPARWRGHLNALLPKRQKLTRGHHAAMPYASVPEFMARLREAKGVGARALEFTILTVGRTTEVIASRWTEVDLTATVWTVPPERMKAERDHRVPLVPRAMEILRELHETRTSDFIFPGVKPGKPISAGTMTKALQAAGGGDFTVHGFRSSFRDWVGEETSFPDAIAEAALAHIVGDETERAYRRGDALAKRRKLMDAWARYCLADARQDGKQNVLPMRRRKAAAA